MTKSIHILFIIISFFLTEMTPCAISYCHAQNVMAPDSIAGSEPINELIVRMNSLSNIPPVQAARMIMKQEATDSTRFRMYLDMAEKTYGDLDSPLRDDTLLIPFLEEALSQPVLSSAEKERVAFLLEMAKKNLPGTKAADFSFDDRDGQTRTLHCLPSDRRILLIFYDPDCNHCHETFEQIIQTEFPEPIRIVAVDAEGDRILWDASASSLPDDWTVGFATDPVQDEDIYILMTTPTLYLLDRDKTVILKDTSLPHILSALNPPE